MVRSKLTYANVIATLALFLALGGGAAWAAGQLGKNAVKSRNIAPHAVKNKNLARNAVKASNIAKNAITATKVKAGSLTAAQLAPGTVSGHQVAEFSSAAVPGLGATESPSAGTPVPLAGTTAFTPAAGKSYEILTEMKGNPVDADGDGVQFCYSEVIVLANGQAVTWAYISADTSSRWDVYKVQSTGSNSAALGLLESGKPVTFSAVAVTNGGCNPIAASFKATVIELG